MVKAELMVGVHKSRDFSRQAEILDTFLEGLTVLPFDEPAADIYGALRASIEEKDNSIGANDMLISAHTISEKLTLIASDGHFQRIDRLKVNLWAGLSSWGNWLVSKQVQAKGLTTVMSP